MSEIKQKKVVPIRGMHCRSCELLVEEHLRAVPGVDRVNVNYRRGQAEIYYQRAQPADHHISEAIAQAGYSVGEDEAEDSFFSHRPADYQDLGIALVILLGLYFVLKGFGLSSLSVNTAADQLTLPLVILVGLTAGFSTCMALVGGLVLGISARHAEKHPEATTIEKMRPHLFFNLGRVVSFAALGGVLGLVGSAFQLSSTSLGVMTIIVGIVMLVMGLQLVEIFPWANSFKLTLPKSLAKVLGLGRHQKEYSHRGAMIMGALTFFLPCGFTQAMQVYAVSTGNFWGGALVMGAFALGTLPGLLSIGGLTAALKGVFARRFFKGAGLAVLAFAIFNINNGLNLAGWSGAAFSQANAVNVSDPNVVMENGVQVVKMKETNRGYEPNRFTIKKGVPVKWVITAEAPYSCASSLVMSKYGIRKNLRAGENIIEFTPTEVGQVKFSCSMGMYTGVFNVVDGSARAPVNTAQAASPTNDQPVAAGCGIGATGPSATVGTGGSGGGCGGASAGPSATVGTGGCGCGGGGSGGCGGAGVNIKKDTSNTIAQVENGIQVIKSTYTANNYLAPNSFEVKVGQSVKFIIDVKDDGRGCGYDIIIPGLYDKAIPLSAGQTITMEFTPKTIGSYDITCGMGMIRYGTIVVK